MPLKATNNASNVAAVNFASAAAGNAATLAAIATAFCNNCCLQKRQHFDFDFNFST